MVNEIEHQKLLDRVKKLLALSENPGENGEQLALRAAEKAHRLLTSFNLTMEDVRPVQEVPKIVEDNDIVIDVMPWVRPICTAVAKLYYSGHFYRTVKVRDISVKAGFRLYDCHTFIGEQHNVIVAKEISGYIVNRLLRAAREESLKTSPANRGRFTTSFLNAAAARIVERIDMLKSASMTNTPLENRHHLPAIISLYKQAEDSFQRSMMKRGYTSNGLVLSAGHAAGAAAGKKTASDISLNTQINQPKAAGLLT